MEEEYVHTCKSCAYFGKSVHDSTITGVPAGARYCHHPATRLSPGKCSGPDTPACVHHSQLRGNLDKVRASMHIPLWEVEIPVATSLNAVVAPLANYIREFANNLDVGINGAPTYPPVSSLKDALSYAIANTPTLELRTGLTHSLFSTIVATLNPLFEETHTNIQVSGNAAIEMIEERYAPICKEVERLRREVEELKNENSNSLRLPLGNALKDEV